MSMENQIIVFADSKYMTICIKSIYIVVMHELSLIANNKN